MRKSAELIVSPQADEASADDAIFFNIEALIFAY